MACVFARSPRTHCESPAQIFLGRLAYRCTSQRTSTAKLLILKFVPLSFRTQSRASTLSAH
jgi:hypothetical protein